MASFPVDDRLVEDFEQLLRSGGKTNELQDKLMASVSWMEGKALTRTLLESVQTNARRTLKQFLMEQPGYTALGGITPDPSCADHLEVVHDGQGHLSIHLPAEVRRWLLQTQSMISS